MEFLAGQLNIAKDQAIAQSAQLQRATARRACPAF
jgi:hypothetical protein